MNKRRATLITTFLFLGLFLSWVLPAHVLLHNHKTQAKSTEKNIHVDTYQKACCKAFHIALSGEMPLRQQAFFLFETCFAHYRIASVNAVFIPVFYSFNKAPPVRLS